MNYDDLNSWNISEVKGYGPCNVSSWRSCSCNNKAELHKQFLNSIVINNTAMQVNIYNIWINKWPGSTPGGRPGQSFRFKITSERGSTTNDWYKYIENKPKNYGGGEESSNLLWRVNNANWKTGYDTGGAVNTFVAIPIVVGSFGTARPAGSKYYKTASVLLKNAENAEEFLKYLEKEYLRVNGRHGKMDRGGHSLLVSILQRNLNNYYNGSTIDDYHTNRK